MAGAVPLNLLVHRVTVQTYRGTTGKGVRTFDDESDPIRAFVDHKVRLVRSSSTGQEVMSSATVIVRPGELERFPPYSLVRLPDGSVREVIERMNRDGGSLPVPSHVELALT